VNSTSSALIALLLLVSSGPFRDEAAGFEARFVGEPAKDEKTQVVRGVTVVTHRYIEEVNGLGLVVSWADHPESAKTTPEQRLLAVRDTALDGAPAQSDVALDAKTFGVPGREFTFERDGVRVSQRAFVRGKRLYQALAVRPVLAKREDAVRTFLDAFKVLPEKPAGAKSKPGR
jgi:hypothetical protein